ncbi:DUF4031 domain-containing protein [Pseudomonas tohonis]|uniref:DUF4031 domain-containing protein n=1 Tax=Pseudomonas tohonis TaxID=2725477 RepID=UPI001F3E83E3|nr:DUF4031 domain-containing protein [Pseudomonas tohonis]
MPVYVDNVRIKWRGKEWCHLVADTLDELHEFASSLGLKRSWFQHSASYPHYDITISTRKKALQLGAHQGSRKVIIQCAKSLKSQYEFSSPKEKITNPQLRLL